MPPQVHAIKPVPEDQLIPVRVAVRQLDYLTNGKNSFDQDIIVVKTAYGPGMPMNDPARKFPGIDMSSQKYADAQSDFQRGELIMLMPRQYEGLSASGAIKDVVYDDDDEELEEDEELLDVRTASVDELASWITETRPTVQDVVDASAGEPELAKKLLEAEAQAHAPGEPRKGVLEGLTAVVSRG